MDFFVLTLSEASGLYLGLQLQHMLRISLWYWPWIFITIGVVREVYRTMLIHPDDRSIMRPWAILATYLGVSLFTLVFLWPEALPKFGFVRILSSTQVASYAAQQDGAPLQTAWDTGEIVQDGTFAPLGFHTFLFALTDTPLRFARAMNPDVSTAFRPLVSMSWLLNLHLPADVTQGIADWVEGCWKPSMRTDVEFEQAIGATDLLPWGNTPVAQALATHDVVPGAQTGKGYFRRNTPLGLAFLSNPDSPTRVRCDVYLAAVEQEAQRLLFTNTSPAGTSLSQVFQEDLGRDVAWQARFLVYRAAMDALRRPSPAPSLGGAYAAATGVNAATGAVSGAFNTLSNPKTSWWGTLGGAATGSAGAVGNQFAGVVEKATVVIGFAMLFIDWSPLIFGFALEVLIALFPVAILYSLLPGRPFQPLVLYMLALLFVCCAPFWFALVDLWARTAAAQAPLASDAILSLFNWAPQMTKAVIATILGLGMVWTLGAAILFMSARGMVSTLRS